MQKSMEEANGTHLKGNDEIVKDRKLESENDDNKTHEQIVIKTEGKVCLNAPLSDMDKSTTDKPVIESNLIEQSSMKTEKYPMAGRNYKSNEDKCKNKQQTDLKDEKGVEHSVSLRNMKESTTGKRKMDEFEGLSEGGKLLSTKKIKDETTSVSSGKSNEDKSENQQQKDMRIRKEEEAHFLRLFTLVLDTIIARKNTDYIAQSISTIKYSFIPDEDININFPETDFTQWKNICAYLYRYGSHGAGFARYMILNAIRNCEKVENILKKPDLKIIFLGSGPGNDAVGFCSALSELQYPKSLKLILVDTFEEWDECIKLAENFIKSQNLGRVSELFQKTNVDFDFIQVDLPGDLKSDKKYFKILGEADVIVASKFFTSLDRKNYGAIERSIINSLHEHMKEDAVILVNDILVYLEDRWEAFCHVYKWPDEVEWYESTAKAGERFRSNDNVSSKLPIHVFVKNTGSRDKSQRTA